MKRQAIKMIALASGIAMWTAVILFVFLSRAEASGSRQSTAAEATAVTAALTSTVYIPVAFGPPTGTCYFGETNGQIIMEVESTPPTGDWVAETAYDGYLGERYYRWNGDNYFADPGHGVLTYNVYAAAGGTYNLYVRNLVTATIPGEENDIWVRWDGLENENGLLWAKSFSWESNHWSWATLYDQTQSNPQATVYLTPGPQKIYISGRSHNFRIDRIAIGTGANNDALPVSECVYVLE